MQEKETTFFYACPQCFKDVSERSIAEGKLFCRHSCKLKFEKEYGNDAGLLIRYLESYILSPGSRNMRQTTTRLNFPTSLLPCLKRVIEIESKVSRGERIERIRQIKCVLEKSPIRN